MERSILRVLGGKQRHLPACLPLLHVGEYICPAVAAAIPMRTADQQLSGDLSGLQI